MRSPLDDDMHTVLPDVADSLGSTVIVDSPLPRLRPITDDLLAVIAYQQAEIDALRIKTNQPPCGQRRVFTTDQLKEGRSLGPTAMFTDPDTLVVKLES